MSSRTFTSLTGLNIVVIAKKTAIIFELDPSQENKVSYNFEFQFTPKDFKDLLAYIETAANESWTGLVPKVANSVSSDYDEYYDKEFDNNGGLRIKGYGLVIERPTLESNRLYQFSKRKMESFIYDIKKL